MKTSVQPGNEMNFLAAAAIASGDIVVAGVLVGISASEYVSGQVGVAELVGVHRLTKVASQVWLQGEPVYKSLAANTVSNIATSNTFMGYAFSGALSADATGLVLLSRPGS